MTLNEQIIWCKDQIKKDYEVIAVKSILTRLEALKKEKAPVSAIYNKCVGEYKSFIQKRNLPFLIDARQGRALKNIIEKLSAASVEKSDAGILNSWKFILINWERTGDFIGRQIQLSDIDRNLLEILDKIRNGANKQQGNISEAQRLHYELTKE